MRALISKGTLVLGVVLSVCAAVAEDAYVQSDKTQYIDTGYVIKPTTRVELDMQLLTANTGGDQYFFGIHGLPTGYLYFCSYAAKAGLMCYCCKKDACDWVQTTCPSTTDRRTVVLDGYHNVYSVIQGGVTNFTKTVTGVHDSGSSVVTMAILGSYNVGGKSVDGKCAMKLYGCRIYEADELVMNLVPCVWGGVVGVKDMVGGRFLKPNGTNALTYGGDILEGDDGYLHSTGTQYIITDYYATGTTRAEIDLAFDDTSTVAGRYTFGVNDAASGGLMFGMFMNNYNDCGWNCQDGSSNYGSFGVSPTTGRRTFVIDGAGNKCHVISYGVTNVTKEITTTHSGGLRTYYPLPVFCTNYRGTYTGHVAMRLYGFRLYEDGEQVRNFIPCVKGGVAGLKDTLSGKFFSDRATDPTARLTGGGNILTEDDDPYVKGDGFQAFDTGVFIDSTTRVELDIALDKPAKGSDQYLLGSTTSASGKLIFGSYIDKNGAYAYNCKAGEANWGWVGAVSCSRQLQVIDALNSKVQVYESNVLRYETTIKEEHGGSDNVLTTKYTTPILGNKNNSDTPSAITAAKVYSFKVYKNGELVNDFEPYVQDCVVGLRDSKTGNFISSPRNVKGFTAGGAIAANVEEDAYLSSNQRQAIDTGYFANPNSCIEVDFALNQHTNCQERIFGATAGGDFPFGLYGSSTDASWGNFTFKAGATDYSTQIPVDIARHRAILDLKGKQILLITGTKTNSWLTLSSAPTASATWPMFLFGEPADAEGTSAQNLANARIYSVKISENGALVHHYLPYCSGAVIGFKDVLTGDILTDCLPSGEPFAVGCRGWGEDHAAFYEQPQDATISQGETAELSVFAPGAVACQWLKDGEPIAGATGMTYEVSWQKKAPDAEYSVRADFSRYGVKVQSVSRAAKIVNRPNGLILILR